MSDDIKMHFYKDDLKFNDALIIVSMVGMSSIVADFLVGHLDLELVGGMSSELMFPGCEINKGVPLPPFQIYTGEYKDMPDTDFDQIVLISTKFDHELEVVWPLVDKILKWAKEINATAVLTITSLIRQELDLGGKVGVFHVLSSKHLEKYTPRLRSTEFIDGSLSGIPGVMLYRGRLENVPVITLIAETHPDFKDSRAAAAVLETISQLVPKIDMDHEPLLREAEELEEQIRIHQQGLTGDKSSFQ